MALNVSHYDQAPSSCVLRAAVAGMRGLYGGLGLDWKFLGLFAGGGGGGCSGSGLAAVGIFW